MQGVIIEKTKILTKIYTCDEFKMNVDESTTSIHKRMQLWHPCLLKRFKFGQI